MGQCNNKEATATLTEKTKKEDSSGAMSEVPAIVSVDWLKQQIDAGTPKLRILDVTSATGEEPRQEYLE